MKLVQFLIVLVLVACCPKPQPPAVVPPPQEGIAACSTDALPMANDVCDGMFTSEGYACVRCPNGHACIDQTVMVYCVQSTCTTDPNCSLQTADNFSSKRKVRRK